MKSHSRTAARRAGAAVVVALTLGFTAGCGDNQQDPSPQEGEDLEAVAVGVDGDVGQVEVRSLLIVSTAQSEPGRLLGTLSNTAGTEAQITMADNDEDLPLTIPPNGDITFDTEETLLESVAEPPGARVPVTVSSGGESAELLVPVVDGTLEQYRQYVPGGAETESPAPTMPGY
jgi:hypothetical protein